MIVDTSAILAVLFQESDAQIYADAIAAADRRCISAVNLVECFIVLDRQVGFAAGAELSLFMARAHILVEPVLESHVAIARDAYQRFGKGHHPAALNFGDCFAYALARSLGEPLLFKGNDFAQTDIERCAWA